jgi:long-chain fatty acid transport protein
MRWPCSQTFSVLAAVLVSDSWTSLSYGAGLDRNGVGAASMGVGGASVARPQDALGIMTQNEAALGGVTETQVQLGGTLGLANGDFSQHGRALGRLEDTWGVMPDLAVVSPFEQDVGIGLSVTPDTSRLANWMYRDVPGALAGAIYRQRTHRSSILNVRSAVGMGMELGRGFRIGGSLGAVYTRNELTSTYVFQSNALAGAKTWLDLETEGWGVNGDVSIQWQATKDVTFGLSYRSPTSFQTKGQATGDVGAQFRALGLRGVPGRFHYDAQVPTELPQQVSGGAEVSVMPGWRVMGQVDWIDWSQAYSQLDVKLSHGTNRVINALVGSTDLEDRTALEWKDQWVFRVGSEWDVSQSMVLRAGYSYGKSPVPDSTLLPMTAAISEHTLSCGLGWDLGVCTVDLGYQYDLPITRQATGSRITGTEYVNSEVSLEAHWVGLTLGFRL